MPDNERLEREIEEILGKIEHFPDASARERRARRRPFVRVSSTFARWQQAAARAISRVALSQLLLMAFLLILFSFFFRRANPALMNWVLYAGIILFVSSFAIMMFGNRGRTGRTVETTWRGRSISYRTGPSPLDRLRRWWSNRSTPRR